MNTKHRDMFHEDDHPIDSLVGKVIQKQGSTLDVAHLARRIQVTYQASPARMIDPTREGPSIHRDALRPTTLASQRDQSSGSQPNRRIWTRSMLAMAASIAVLMAFAIGRWETSAHASAASLVRAARSVHSLAVERCYVVTVENAPEANEKNFLPFLKDVRIWTNGDRFWVEAKRNERHWVWGRNAEGAVWMTLGDRRALQIEADEIGPPLQHLCDLYSLELESLLTSFQDRWSLTHQSSTELTHTITARPNRNANRTTEAVLEVDRETKAIRRLTLQKNAGSQSESRVVFTLVDSRTQDESKYEPAGHLAPHHQILTREHFAEKRVESLRAWFGSGADRWIKANSHEEHKLEQ